MCFCLLLQGFLVKSPRGVGPISAELLGSSTGRWATAVASQRINNIQKHILYYWWNHRFLCNEKNGITDRNLTRCKKTQFRVSKVEKWWQFQFYFTHFFSFAVFICDRQNIFSFHVQIKFFDATISTQKMRFYGGTVDFPKFKWNWY